MSKLTFENNVEWNFASRYILNLPEIRFVGVIDNMGNLIVGDYKEGVVPIAKPDQYKICLEHALELFMKKDLDGILGSLDYIISKRKHVTIITIPVDDHLVLISVEPNTKIEPIIDEIIVQLNHCNMRMQ